MMHNMMAKMWVFIHWFSTFSISSNITWRLPKKTRPKTPTFLKAYFPSLIKVSLVLGKLAIQILPTCDLLTLPLSHPKQQFFKNFFGWVKHFSSQNYGFVESKRKVQKDKKCNEKLVASVQAVVDTDPRLRPCGDCWTCCHTFDMSSESWPKKMDTGLSTPWNPHILTPQNEG